MEATNVLHIFNVQFVSCLYFEALKEESSGPRLLSACIDCEQASRHPRVYYVSVYS
jgi:hypothetical protein